MSEIISIYKSDMPAVAGHVIFVHGLGGDPRKTWGFDHLGSWSSWIKSNRPDLNIWTIGYEAAISEWSGSAMPLADRALNILALLDNRSIGQKPICFICHSMGGLLVKELLRHAGTVTTRYKYISDNTKGIAFFATPHTGSDLAVIASYMTFFLGPTVAVDQLVANNVTLRDLNLWFRNNFDSIGVKTSIFFETQATRGIRVVNAASSDPGLPKISPIPIDANHLSIIRPRSYGDIVVGQTLKLIDDAIPGQYKFDPDRPFEKTEDPPIFPDEINFVDPKQSDRWPIRRRTVLVGGAATLVALGGVAAATKFSPVIEQLRRYWSPNVQTISSIEQQAIAWFKAQFGAKMAKQLAGTPFTPSFIAALAMSETFDVWGLLCCISAPSLSTGDILELCVGDTLDSPNRSVFPKDKFDLLAAPQGAEMFAIARAALEKVALNYPAYKRVSGNPDKFVHQFGIFGYDLSSFRTSPDFFLQKQWRDFGKCLELALIELQQAVGRAFGSKKDVLSREELVYVAIARNKGIVRVGGGFNQGFQGTDGLFYGEAFARRLERAESVPDVRTDAPPWLTTMRQLTGTRAFNDNPTILGWANKIGQLFPDMANYCASYTHDTIVWSGLAVAYCMAINGIRPIFGGRPEDRFLFSEAWAQFGLGSTIPQPGDVLVFQWADNSHHVTLFEEESGNSFVCRGGNQDHQVQLSNLPRDRCTAIRRPPFTTAN
jgi:hypothetical protein